MAASASRTAADKLGVRDGMRALLRDVPRDVEAALVLPSLDRRQRLSGEFDYLHLFVTRQSTLAAQLPALRRHLAPSGMLWVSWPKRRAMGSDLVLGDVIRIAYDHGLVESKTIALDACWSAIKLTHPKPGKTYRNSFGTLKH